MAEKIARDHHILSSESVYKFRISGIPKLPCYPFPESRFYFGLVTFPIEHFSLLSVGQPVQKSKH